MVTAIHLSRSSLTFLFSNLSLPCLFLVMGYEMEDFLNSNFSPSSLSLPSLPLSLPRFESSFEIALCCTATFAMLCSLLSNLLSSYYYESI